MPNYKTPTTLWSDFDDTLDTEAKKIDAKVEDGVCYEYVSFLGRETGGGRVSVFGVFAYSQRKPSKETLLIFNDSAKSVDETLLKTFVKEGYSAFMVDYRGAWSGTERYTVYPDCIAYANTAKCASRKEIVEEDCALTCWYEWVAVGVYARKYLLERTQNKNIGLIGLRDGGEIAWKLAALKKFTCLVAVCATGWKAYSGMAKYGEAEELNSDSYHFLAGLDSQAYAPLIACPAILLCSTNDPAYDYDRAYDTFTRINPDFIGDSVITYSVITDSTIDKSGVDDMFMFLGKYMKQRQVFIPQPVIVTVSDEEGALVATASADSQGQVENIEMYLAEDCTDSSVRDWSVCTRKMAISADVCEFFLDVYEKCTRIFVLCCARYSSGFTIWSKMSVKRLNGEFTNMQKKCKILFSGDDAKGFTTANPSDAAIAGVFFRNNDNLPKVVEKNGISGVTSKYGLTTYRLNSPRFAPDKGDVLKLDIFCDETAEVQITFEDLSGETYKYYQTVLGKVWQSVILESKMFKTLNGDSLEGFTGNLKLCITCDTEYAVNNVIWL